MGDTTRARMYENARAKCSSVMASAGSLEFESVCTKAQCSAPWSSSLCWRGPLPRVSRGGILWEDADDLVTPWTSVKRLQIWTEGMEQTGIRVNAKNTKVMICGSGLDTLRKSGKYPRGVCLSGVGASSIYCEGCNKWVHKKCSGLF